MLWSCYLRLYLELSPFNLPYQRPGRVFTPPPAYRPIFHLTTSREGWHWGAGIQTGEQLSIQKFLKLIYGVMFPRLFGGSRFN